MFDVSNEILRKVIDGDVKAFEDVYRATSGFVYNVALRILNNREDAQEITQEVFIAVYHKLRNFQFESSFKTWVYRIAVNQALNRVNKNSRIKQQTTSFDALSERDVITVAMTAEETSFIDEQNVKNMLKDLSVDERACVVLRSIEGLSYQEIAETLKININTVRTRLKRAREKLLLLKKKGHYEHL